MMIIIITIVHIYICNMVCMHIYCVHVNRCLTNSEGLIPPVKDQQNITTTLLSPEVPTNATKMYARHVYIVYVQVTSCIAFQKRIEPLETYLVAHPT